MTTATEEGKRYEAAARGIRPIKGSGHPFVTQLEQMEDVERKHGGRNPDAYIPRIQKWFWENIWPKR